MSPLRKKLKPDKTDSSISPITLESTFQIKGNVDTEVNVGAQVCMNNQSLNFDCEILRLLTRSGFVSVKDLGKLLLCASKQMTNSIYTDDEVWKLLMKSRYNFDMKTNGNKDDVSILYFPKFQNQENLSITPPLKQVFHSLQKRIVQRPSLPIRPLKFSPCDYTLIITIYEVYPTTTRDSNGNGAVQFIRNRDAGGRGRKVLLSRIVQGETIPDFFTSGKFKLDLCETKNTPFHEDAAEFEATIHAMRSDGKSCCLLHSFGGDWLEWDQFWFFHSCLEMNDLLYTKTLYDKRIVPPYPHHPTDAIEGVGFELTMKQYGGCCCCGECDSYSDFEEGSFETLAVSAMFHVLDDWFPFEDSGGGTPTKGSNKRSHDDASSQIIFAHFLEEFYGWNH